MIASTLSVLASLVTKDNDSQSRVSYLVGQVGGVFVMLNSVQWVFSLAFGKKDEGDDRPDRRKQRGRDADLA